MNQVLTVPAGKRKAVDHAVFMHVLSAYLGVEQEKLHDDHVETLVTLGKGLFYSHASETQIRATARAVKFDMEGLTNLHVG